MKLTIHLLILPMLRIRGAIPPLPHKSLWRISLMMEAASTSETSVNFYQTTWHNIPEDSHFSPTLDVLQWDCNPLHGNKIQTSSKVSVVR
jgi:hypothetical protein